MSRTTENLHIRGAHRARIVAAIEGRLRAEGLERVQESERTRKHRTSPNLLRIGLRRDGRWITVADARGFGGFGQNAQGDLDGWGSYLSRALDRSVLATWTWDGEASVIATRWKRGVKRGSFELLRDAWRGDDGRARAPAKVLWPWLPKNERAAILRDGIPLVERSTGTGDAELDELLEEFDDADVADDAEETGDGDPIHVPLGTSVGAIGAAVGMTDPMLDPWDERAGDEQLLFRTAAGGPR